MDTANLAKAGRVAGFSLLGELLAIDLANTIKTAVTPARELLPDDAANARFWQLEAPVLPHGAGIPDLKSTLRLRGAVRGLLAALRTQEALDAAAIDLLNTTAALATIDAHLERTPDGLERQQVWRAASPASLALAAVARSAIELVDDPLLARLRECAAPTCSMVFIAANAKRIWCSPDGCGNRQRVARHARGHRPLRAGLNR
jgi:predicted RNA-binding Zn ribbon-like protein